MPDALDRLKSALADRYRIERELGAGGMATVFLAQDLKHKRQVAVKVLKSELAAVLGAERFVQEITTTASLQHPHILPLFDSGEADSFLYYVMPYVEGETLRDKLDRETQLSIDEAVRIATEVADALDYAHRHGVIHRDIKPENILLHDGRAMVADFGIALAVSAAAGGRMTETGLSLGTPHYMSPEQATADRDITSRSDIYSLGSVLYEMLTGNPPHVGASAQQIIMKIVTEDAAPVTKARKSVPPNVAAVVAMAVEKLPADRFVSAKAFADALADVGFHTTTTRARSVGGRAGPASQPMWRRAAIAASLLALGAVAFGLWAWQRRPVMPTVRLSVGFPAGQQIRPAATRRLALTHDGSRLVYVGPDSVGGSQLWVRDLNSLRSRPLGGTSGALGPFFSPDGESVAYFTGSVGDLRVVSVHGGAPRTLVRDSALAWGGSWCDGEIYFTAGGGAGGARVSEQGGAYEMISRPDSATGVSEHDWLQCLPERGLVLAQLWRNHFANAELGLIDIDRGVVTPLVQGVYGRYVPSGHLLYATAAGTLYSVPVDLGQRRVAGQPIIVADGVQLDITSGSAQFDVSDNGILAYMSGGGEGAHRLVWVDRAGQKTAVDSAWSGQFAAAELSPDERRLALALFGGGELQVAIKELPAGPLSRLSAGARAADRPAWSPDGQSLAFLTSSGAVRTAMIRRADGSVPPDTLLASDRSVEEVEFLPDGQRFLVRLGGSQGVRDILIGNRRDSVLRPLLASPADEYAPAVSPDGRWFAYVSGESGRPEVFVRSIDQPGAGRTQISVDGGDEPRWARSGREMYYRSRSGDMMAAEVTGGRTFTARPPRRLFSASGMVGDPFHHAYAVSRDGRFVMINQTAGSDLVMVFNWFEELKGRE